MYISYIEFINDLKLLKYYQEKKSRCELEITGIDYYLYSKVNSPTDYDRLPNGNRVFKTHGNINKEQIAEHKEKLEKQKSRWLLEKIKCENKISEIENTLASLPGELQYVCHEVFVKGRSYEAVADDVRRSKTGLYCYVNRELKKRIGE